MQSIGANEMANEIANILEHATPNSLVIVIELRHQFQNYSGFYDHVEWSFKEVIDSTICCSTALLGESSSELKELFMRHFNVLCVPKQSAQVLMLIFESILGGYLDCHASRPRSRR